MGVIILNSPAKLRALSHLLVCCLEIFKNHLTDFYQSCESQLQHEQRGASDQQRADGCQRTDDR